MNKKFLGLLSGILLFTACKDNPDKKADVEKQVDEITVQKPTMAWELVASADGSKPVARHEAAFVRVDDKFYLLGGRGIRPVSIYDTNTQSWSEGSKPPIEMHHFQPVVYQHKIYLISALTGKYPAETPTEHIYIYDPATDEWSKGDEIPEERRRGSTGNVLYEGKIYISCGIKNGHIGDYKNWMDSYDPSTGEWEVLADAPRARDHFQAVLADGKIYAPAGRNSGIDPDSVFGGTIAEVDVYDIKSDTWETLPENIPTPRAGNAAALFHDELIVVGGESTTQEKAHADVEVLDLNTHKWHTLPSMVEGRHGSGLVLFEDGVYIASGCGNRGGSPELTTMEKLSVED
ncbi:kelch repeat-containing protein [uncultured Zobellia sp.]|uniref:Kelch repeat-containing protein n=1 Tax=uncultured Zobellia sp. TaxID=255433 RepID=UPI0025924B8F|nr:kelch repeat-containing protein [uncultured Zobellia sp.]